MRISQPSRPMTGGGQSSGAASFPDWPDWPACDLEVSSGRSSPRRTAGRPSGRGKCLEWLDDFETVCPSRYLCPAACPPLRTHSDSSAARLKVHSRPHARKSSAISLALSLVRAHPSAYFDSASLETLARRLCQDALRCQQHSNSAEPVRLRVQAAGGTLVN